MTAESQRFDRLPATVDDLDGETPAGGADAGTGGSDDDTDRPLTRETVLDFWAERFGVPRETFADHTFWERGRGKVWAFRGTAPSPVAIQGLGITFLRTRQEHWKPTTDAVQRFGHTADRNVLRLDPEGARHFLAGEDRAVEWDGDWGYLIVTHELAGREEPIGVGLYLHGELRSQIPKGRRREL